VPESSSPRTQDTTGSLQNFAVHVLPDGKVQEAVALGDGTNNDRVVGVTAAPSGMALKVDVNASQRATYIVSRGPASGTAPTAPIAPAAVANADKILLTGWHPASSTKLVKVKRVTISALLGTAVTYLYSLYRMAAVVPTGGTAVVSRPTDSSEVASDTSWMYQNTTALATAVQDGSICDVAQIGAVGGHNAVTLYEWMPGGAMESIFIRPGVLEGIVITSRTTTATAPDAIITVEYTEE